MNQGRYPEFANLRNYDVTKTRAEPAARPMNTFIRDGEVLKKLAAQLEEAKSTRSLPSFNKERKRKGKKRKETGAEPAVRSMIPPCDMEKS